MRIRHNEEFQKVANTIKIELLECGFSELDKEWRQQDVCSPYSRLYYVISGMGYLCLHGDDGQNPVVQTLRPGYLYLIPNGLSYDYFCEDRLEKVHFHINVLLQNGLELFSGCRDCYELFIGDTLPSQMKQWLTGNQPEDYFRIQGEIYHTVAMFIKEAGVADKVTRQYSRMVSDVFALLPGLNLSVTVQELAKMLNVSESSMSKHFRKETGMSIGDYRGQLVMSRARQLLAMGRMSIGEIAEELGFSDQFYFSKYFKQHQGITPSAYKQYYK